MPPIVVNPYCAAIWLSSSKLSPSICGVSLRILPTTVFVIPSQKTDFVHMIYRQSSSLLADDQPRFREGTLGFNT